MNQNFLKNLKRITFRTQGAGKSAIGNRQERRAADKANRNVDMEVGLLDDLDVPREIIQTLCNELTGRAQADQSKHPTNKTFSYRGRLMLAQTIYWMFSWDMKGKEKPFLVFTSKEKTAKQGWLELTGKQGTYFQPDRKAVTVEGLAREQEAAREQEIYEDTGVKITHHND